MRVVYVSTLERGGPVSHLLGLAPEVAEHADVRVVCPTAEVAQRFAAAGVDTVVAPVASKWDVLATRRLRDALAGADVVHTQDRRAGQFGRVLARTVGAAVVHTYHGLPEDIAVLAGRDDLARADLDLSPKRRAWLFGIYLPIERALARLGLVVSPSHAMAAFLSDVGIPDERLRIVPSAIDVRRSATPPPSAPLRIATAANLEHWKGVDVLLDAAAKATTAVAVDIYGDGSLREALEVRARALGVDATFHGNVTDVRDRLLTTDLFVLPSRAENLPVSILEAMAAALPVIASRVGGVPELVDDGVSGLVVAPDDPVAMADAIGALASDDGRRRAMGAAGADRARRLFAPDVVAGRLLEVYGEACASSR